MIDIQDTRRRCKNAIRNSATGRHLGAALDELEEARLCVARLGAMMPLFEEARDALPAISEAAARLHHVDLTLADRMDSVGIPSRWAKHPQNPAAMEAEV